MKFAVAEQTCLCFHSCWLLIRQPFPISREDEGAGVFRLHALHYIMGYAAFSIPRYVRLVHVNNEVKMPSVSSASFTREGMVAARLFVYTHKKNDGL